MDDADCLFITVSCMLGLILPSAAQPLFALLALGLVILALTSGMRTSPRRPARQQGDVPGHDFA
jgi:hypothetical protein